MAIIFQSPDEIRAKLGKEFEFGQIDALITEHYASIAKLSRSTQNQIKLVLQLETQYEIQQQGKLRAREVQQSKDPSTRKFIKKDNETESAFEWKKTSLKKAYLLSEKAVVIGEDFDGVPLWVIRAQMEDSDLNIGKFVLNRTFASVPADGSEVLVNDDFEVLCKKDDSAINWVRFEMGDAWPNNAMLAGEIGLSTKMYVGRIKKNGHDMPGKVINEVLYVPYQGQEYQYDSDFEVLVESQKSDKKSISKSTKKSEPAFIWKKTCIEHAHNLRDKAVIGGIDHEGVPLWVIRAQLEDEDLTLGSFNPNRSFASVPKDGHDVLVHDYFDVLCKKKKGALHWMIYKKSKPWPSQAVLGGEMENTTQFYVGRVKHNGLHIPGKIINKVFYTAYRGHELQFSDKFEVLVSTNNYTNDDKNLRAQYGEYPKTANRTFSWKKTCLIHLKNKQGCKAKVGGQDHNGNPLWIIRTHLDENDLAIGNFNPNTSYASVPKDGQEIAVQDHFHVLCENKKNALDWFKYTMSDPWPENAVIAGEMENFTKIFVGRTKQDGLDTLGKVIDMVLYTAYQGEEHQYKDNFEVLVESHDDSKKPSNTNEDNPETGVLWTKTCLKKAHLLKDLAVVGGTDHEGTPLWIIRAQVENDDMNLGIFNSYRCYASVTKDGHEILVHGKFDVLCQKKNNTLQWVNHKKSDPWPKDVVYASEMENSTKMYVGRVKQDGNYIPGKIINEIMIIAHQGLEYKYDNNFEVLVEFNTTSQQSNTEEKSKHVLNPFVTWKNTKLEDSHLLSEEAIVGGEDFSGSPVWIIRSNINNDLSIGKFNPNLTYATVAQNGAEVLVDDNFDVLCSSRKDAVKWLLHRKEEYPMPKNAVVAGKTGNSEMVFVGRYNMGGHHTPGKVIDKTLYIAYQGLEFQYTQGYEILVTKSTIEPSTIFSISTSMSRATTKKTVSLSEVATTALEDDQYDEDEYFQAISH